MTEATFTFRVDDSLKSAFAQAAKRHDRTGAQLLRDFMREYVRQNQDIAEYEAWFKRKVDIGSQAAKDGYFVTHEEVAADVAARRTMLLGRIGGQRK